MSKKKQPRYLSRVSLANIRQLALGEAENDKRLNEYYVGRETYLDQALNFNDHTCAFVGPKGVGKSAILQMVRLEKASETKRIINVFPDDLAFSTLANIEQTTPLLKDAGQLHPLFKALWNYVLCVEIAKREYGADGVLAKLMGWFTHNSDQRRVKELLKKTFDDEGSALSFSDKMLALIDEVEFAGKVEGAGASVKVKLNASKLPKQQLAVLHLINEVANFLSKPEVLRTRYYVLIDDLDLYWHNSPVQSALIEGLFLSLRKLNHAPNLKFCVSLRDYIFEAMHLPDKEKIRDSVCQVRWDAKFLKEMVRERCSVLLGCSSEDVWQQVFPVNAFKTMFHHTSGVPRDIIRVSCLVLEQAKRNGSAKPTSKNLVEGIVQFSKEQISNTASRYQYEYPGLDRLILRLQGRSIEFDFATLGDIAVDVGIHVEKRTKEGKAYSWAGGYYDNPLELAEILAEIGVLRIKDSRKARPRDFVAGRDELSEKTRYAVHPMYAAGLGMESFKVHDSDYAVG